MTAYQKQSPSKWRHGGSRQLPDGFFPRGASLHRTSQPGEPSWVRATSLFKGSRTRTETQSEIVEHCKKALKQSAFDASVARTRDKLLIASERQVSVRLVQTAAGGSGQRTAGSGQITHCQSVASRGFVGQHLYIHVS